jgi:hypothetical protein
LKQKCRYCGKQFDIRGVGPHESRCPEKPSTVTNLVSDIDDIVDKFWSLLTKQDKIRLVRRYLDEGQK